MVKEDIDDNDHGCCMTMTIDDDDDDDDDGELSTCRCVLILMTEVEVHEKKGDSKMHHFSHITAQHRDYPSPLRRQQYQPHYDYPSTFYFRPQKKPVRVLVLVLVLVMMTRLFFVTDAQQDYGDEKNNSPGKLVVMKSAKST